MPISLKSFGSLSGTFCGAGSFRGGIDDWPYPIEPLLAACTTLPPPRAAARRVDLPLALRREHEQHASRGARLRIGSVLP